MVSIKRPFKSVIAYVAMIIVASGWFPFCHTLYARTVVDRTGKPVVLPPVINRIIVTCYGGAGHEIAVLGGADKIIAQPTSKPFPEFLKIYPGFGKLPSVGSFNNVNIEEVVAMRPDIVIASITSTQANEKIRRLGIPVVTVGTNRTDVEGLLQEFRMVGQILGAQKRANELIGYWRHELALIKKRTGLVLKKKRVFYSTLTAPLRTEGDNTWGVYYIEAAGGIDVAKGIKGVGTVTREQLLAWNPDAIIRSMNLIRSSKYIVSDPGFSDLKAIRNNAVYKCPIGAFWWDRPSPEAILGILWLAKKLYPKEMKDISIKKETMAFYSRFYHYNLSQKEYEAFFVSEACPIEGAVTP